MMNLDDLISGVSRLRKGAKESFSHGREDYREALKRAYAAEGRETDGSRINQMLGSNRTVTMVRDLLGKSKPEHVKARNEMGLGLSDDGFTRAGQVLGTLGADVVQDRARELWWLLNAPQAAANVAQEMMLHKYAPDLYKAEKALDAKGNPITSKKAASMAGLIDNNGRPKAGVSIGYEDGNKVYNKRKHPAGYVEALAIPAGLAVNTGIGLMNPFGGQEGYKAVMEDPDDSSKTNNVVGEVAAKYILGKTGGLLPWDEFKQVRPDVSKDEYMRYKAFKFDNDGDINPFDDGQVVMPTGIIKGTAEGIHGPEVQFLGRSLPLTTALIPTATAMVGTTLGAAGPRGGTRRGLGGGIAGALGGMAVGNLLEQERRRRNAAANEMNTIDTID